MAAIASRGWRSSWGGSAWAGRALEHPGAAVAGFAPAAGLRRKIGQSRFGIEAAVISAKEYSTSWNKVLNCHSTPRFQCAPRARTTVSSGSSAKANFGRGQNWLRCWNLSCAYQYHSALNSFAAFEPCSATSFEFGWQRSFHHYSMVVIKRHQPFVDFAKTTPHFAVLLILPA